MLQGERLYQSFVFLEIRVLILSDEKAFCTCKAGSAAEHCAICTRIPGAPPLLKEQIARDAYRLAHSLGCTLIHMNTRRGCRRFLPNISYAALR